MAASLPASGRILGLDIGNARIGLASASVIARLPQPIETLANDEALIEQLKAVISREDARLLVVGIPRNMNGEETQQSDAVRELAAHISASIELPLVFADESLSSKRADEYLKQTPGAAQDSIAACFILDEFLGTIE